MTRTFHFEFSARRPATAPPLVPPQQWHIRFWPFWIHEAYTPPAIMKSYSTSPGNSSGFWKKQRRAPLGRSTKWRKVRFASPLVCAIPNELLINSPARPVRRDPSRLTEFWTCVSVFLEVLFETLYGPCLFVINTDGKKCHYKGMGWVKVMEWQEIAQFIPVMDSNMTVMMPS